MNRLYAMLVISILCLGVAHAAETPSAQDGVKKETTSSSTPSSATSDPTLQREVTVDAKGVKTLKLIGNDPNFDAEHAEWLRNKDAQTRAQALALASEQRKQAEAAAKAAEAKAKAEESKSKADATKNKAKKTSVKNTQKSKRTNPPMMTGGGTVQ